MTMQIVSLCLYNSNGDIRKLDFRQGKVNIITGKSSTGKSAIIDIIEYCLGRSSFRVPEGPIRDKVVWYAVIYQVNDMQVLIAKPAPGPTRSSQSEVHFEVAPIITLPNLSNLKTNSTDEAIVEYLTRVIGISSNVHTPEEGQSRTPLEATIRHASFLLFQKQNTIANQEILFHRQADAGIFQAIKDTLPYFLGAIREDRLKLIQELREFRRQLRLLRRKLQEVDPQDTEELSRGRGLIREAQQVGLIPDEVNPQEPGQIIDLLRSTLAWEPSSLTLQTSDQISQLQTELRELRAQFQRKIGQIGASENFAAEAEGYTSEANEQQLRLQSINLMISPQEDVETCPLCSSKMSTPIPTASTINRALQQMQANLQVTQRERPRLRNYIQQLIRDREDIRRRIIDTESNIARLIEEDANGQQNNISNNRISRVLGRISFYLESLAAINDSSPLNSEINRLERQIELHQRELDSSDVDDVLASILSLLSVDMTDWAKRLDLEYAGSPYRLDLNKLTVVADRPGRPILMSQGMGGGQNWLGCHLITYLALHKHFINQSRPVPNFIVLDQPTQVYFPEDKYRSMEGNTNELTDEDRVAVSRIFGILFNVCEEVFPNLQIIVLDHANIDTEEFQSALVEEPWRGGKALIPSEWL